MNSNRAKIYLNLDRAITACLCILIFCLPFAKAGISIFVSLAFMLWLIKRALGYKAGPGLSGFFPKTPLNKAIAIYILANLISLIFSSDYGLSLKGFFGKELKFILIYFMLVEVITTKKRLNSVLFTLIASALLLTVDAGVQYFRGVDFLRGYELHYLGDWARSRASFSNPNSFAGWLIVIIPLFLGLITTNIIKSKFFKALLSLLIVILLVCLLTTYSRGAWIGLGIGILLILYYVIKKAPLKIRMWFLFIVICLLLIFLSLSQPMKAKIKAFGEINFKGGLTLTERIDSITRMDNQVNSIRINLLKEALLIIKDHPLVGCGVNTYSKVIRNYSNYEYGRIYPHNSYIQKTAETGLLGILAFLLILFGFLKISIEYIFHFEKRNKVLVLGLVSGILAFLTHSFFDNHLYSLQLVVLFWFMLGLTIAVINIERKEGIS